MMGNNDFKYVLQDTSHLYIGAKYTYEEILENDDVPFKIKAIIAHYIAKDDLLFLTFEEHLKQMKETDMTYMVWKQLKVKVKTTKLVMPLVQYRKRVIENKESFFVEEIIISKLSLMTFSV